MEEQILNSSKIIKQIWHDKLLIIAILTLLTASFFGTPRIQDVNWSTLEALATLMLSVAMMNHFQLLKWLSQHFLRLVTTQRQLTLLMVGLAFLASMFLTNDVAIITLVPIYLTMVKRYHLKVALPVTLITIAANLGSSTMPFGNPQNLFLVNFYHFSFMKVVVTMLPVSISSLLLISLLTLLIPAVPLKPVADFQAFRLAKLPIMIVLVLMILTFVAIFDIISLPLMLLIMVISAFLLYRRALIEIDYGLLITFICFFLTVGILQRLSWVNHMLSMGMHASLHQYGMALLVSQFISNVPTAVLLAPFASHGNAVLLGTNISGLGTLVASLANLLAFKIVVKQYPAKQFLMVFSIVNVGVLVLLAIVGGIVLV